MSSIVDDRINQLVRKFNGSKRAAASRMKECSETCDHRALREVASADVSDDLFVAWLLEVISASSAASDELRDWASRSHESALENLERGLLNVGLASALSGNIAQAIADFRKGLSLCPWSEHLDIYLELAKEMADY